MTINEEKAAAGRELSWLLSALDDTVAALRAGLADCRSLLAPPPLGVGGGTTLALSTARSEALKGVVTRAGSRITRSDMRIKMAGLPPGFRLALAGPHSDGQQQRQQQQQQQQPQPQPQQQHQAPPQLVLEQLVDAGNHVAAALEILHGDGAFPRPSDDARAVLDALGALMGHVAAARTALKGAAVHRLFPYHAADPRTFDPPLPASLAVDVYISEAALVAELRTLEPTVAAADGGGGSAKSAFLSLDAISPFGFRERFAAAVGIAYGGGASGARQTHGVAGSPEQLFEHRGVAVRVRELVRVEAQDPSLMAAWAKLGGLEHVLAATLRALRQAMVAAGLLP